MLPVLLVEDDQSSEERFTLLLEKVSLSLGMKFKIDRAEDYREAIVRATYGTYPLAIVDLALPDPLAGAEHALEPFLGMNVIALLHKYNKDSVVGAYTAYVPSTAPELVRVHVDGIFSKTQTDDILMEKLSELIREAVVRFNYMIDVHVEDALTLAFGANLPAWSRWDQWEICFRRSLCRAQEAVDYDSIGRGHSGAGTVVVYVDGGLPMVTKLDLYEKLQDEVGRYNRFVKDYIPRCALTSRDDLSQAGEAGILAYSFVGLEHSPIALAKVINQYSPEQIVNALSEHFGRNCERWFARGGTTKPYDLGPKCYKHFGPDPENIRSLCSDGLSSLAVDAAAEFLQDFKSSGLIDTITNAIGTRWRRVLCKPETIVHGDLNANNLIWDGEHLWMIDFSRTGFGPRLLDFAKLEASLKFDVVTEFENPISDKDKISAMLEAEKRILDVFELESSSIFSNCDANLCRKLMAIATIRSCAKFQCGPQANTEYWLVLFFATAKHVEYLARDITQGKDVYIPLVHALFSAYRLAKILEVTLAE